MSATIELLDQYKASIGTHADRTAARTLGVSAQTVSNWRKRGSQAEPWVIAAMCESLGADLADWLLRAQMEQSFSAKSKLTWQRLIEQLGRRVASVALLIAPATMALQSDLRSRGWRAFIDMAL